MKKLTSNGFGLVPVIVMMVLVGLLVFAGLRINNSRKDDKKTPEQNTSQKVESTIKNTNDVEATTKELDTVEVDKELDTSDLENDINSVL